MSKRKHSESPMSVELPNVEHLHVENTSTNGLQWAGYRGYFLILMVACSFLYINTLKNQYALDDQLAIFDNQFVTKGFEGIPDILTHDAFVGFFGERGSKLISGGRYRPLSFVTFAVEWQFFGKNPMIGHFVNMILYSIIACFLFVFLHRLYKETLPQFDKNWELTLPFLVTLLFAFHPIHSEVVANIKGRDELLALLFSLWACILFILYHNSMNPKRYIFLFSIMFLALMSKENSITFLAIFPLISYFGKDKILFNFRVYVPIVLACVVFLFLRFHYTHTGVTDTSSEILNNPFLLATTREKYGTIIDSFFRYIILLIFPKDLTHDYYYNQIPYKSLTSPLVMAVILAMIGVLVFSIKKFKSQPIPVFGVLFFIITFSIVSNVFFTVGIIMNERFVFISSIGFCIVLAYYLLKIKSKPLLYSLVGLILGLYSFKTIDRNRAWKDNFTLFYTDFKTSSNSAKVSTSLGGTYGEIASNTKDSTLRNLQLDSSIYYLRHSLEIYPENSQTWLLLGNSLVKRTQNHQLGIDNYRKALQYRPQGYFDGNYNMAVSFYNLNELDSSLKYSKLAYEIDPNHVEAKAIYSKLLAQKGQTDEAVKIMGNSASSSLGELASLAVKGGNIDEAMKLSEQALATNANDPEANYVKGICLAKHLNRLQEGLPYLQKAVDANTKNPVWMEDLAVCYGFVGQVQKTIPLFEEVIKIRPQDPNGYFNIAASYAKMGNTSKAQYYTQIGNQHKAK